MQTADNLNFTTLDIFQVGQSSVPSLEQVTHWYPWGLAYCRINEQPMSRCLNRGTNKNKHRKRSLIYKVCAEPQQQTENRISPTVENTERLTIFIIHLDGIVVSKQVIGIWQFSNCHQLILTAFLRNLCNMAAKKRFTEKVRVLF